MLTNQYISIPSFKESEVNKKFECENPQGCHFILNKNEDISYNDKVLKARQDLKDLMKRELENAILSFFEPHAELDDLHKNLVKLIKSTGAKVCQQRVRDTFIQDKIDSFMSFNPPITLTLTPTPTSSPDLTTKNLVWVKHCVHHGFPRAARQYLTKPSLRILGFALVQAKVSSQQDKYLYISVLGSLPCSQSGLEIMKTIIQYGKCNSFVFIELRSLFHVREYYRNKFGFSFGKYYRPKVHLDFQETLDNGIWMHLSLGGPASCVHTLQVPSHGEGTISPPAPAIGLS